LDSPVGGCDIRFCGLSLLSAVFTVSYTFFFGMKDIRAQYVIATTLTVTITLILFLIYVLDHLYRGEQGKRGIAQGRDGDNANGGVSAPLLAPKLRQILTRLLPCRFSFALCLGHSAQLGFAHRFVHPSRSPFE
jgi:Na+/proline symporter